MALVIKLFGIDDTLSLTDSTTPPTAPVTSPTTPDTASVAPSTACFTSPTTSGNLGSAGNSGNEGILGRVGIAGGFGILNGNGLTLTNSANGKDTLGRVILGTLKLSIFLVMEPIALFTGAVAPAMIPEIPELTLFAVLEIFGVVDLRRESTAFDFTSLTADFTADLAADLAAVDTVEPRFGAVSFGIFGNRDINYFPSWPGANPPPTV